MILKFDNEQAKSLHYVYTHAAERISYPGKFRAYWNESDYFVIEVLDEINTLKET